MEGMEKSAENLPPIDPKKGMKGMILIGGIYKLNYAELPWIREKSREQRRSLVHLNL
jgi:hypothetical protein